MGLHILVIIMPNICLMHHTIIHCTIIIAIMWIQLYIIIIQDT